MPNDPNEGVAIKWFAAFCAVVAVGGLCFLVGQEVGFKAGVADEVSRYNKVQSQLREMGACDWARMFAKHNRCP